MVADDDVQLVGDPHHLDLDRLRGGRELQRVLDQVHERALDLRPVDERRDGLLRQPHDDTLGGGPDRVDRASHQLVARQQRRPRLRGTGLEARQVDEVRDESLEARGLARDRLE